MTLKVVDSENFSLHTNSAVFTKHSIVQQRNEAYMSERPIMIGRSAAIRGVQEDVDYAAQSTAKVLITGESGVGKEIIARMLHERSPRARGPLVTINCAGVPDTLLESALFGHVRGSFTDAYADKRGLLESAHGGTAFLDEVGEMSPRMQAMLLRFLETGEIQRVGSDRRLPSVDVRVITATHRRLIDRVATGEFREDLYYRLNVVHIEVPPLRDRSDDIPVLVEHFLTMFATTHGRPMPRLTPVALDTLTAYRWPGNVRELRNVAERLVLQCRSGVVDVEGLPAETRRATHKPVAAGQGTPSREIAQVLFDRLLKDGMSFWSEVYEPFMARDLTRNDLRAVIRLGLEHTRGNYRMLVRSFNMSGDDYKKFLSFLRKYQCHVPFQGFRMERARLPVHSDDQARVAGL
jgi:DNA-binding NtrC family response regulator